MLSCFKAYDIRGRVLGTLNAPLAHAFGRSVVEVLGALRVVVNGTAEVTNGNEVRLFSENQSTYIPVGTKHCLKNPGVIPLVLIKIQSGAYLVRMILCGLAMCMEEKDN